MIQQYYYFFIYFTSRFATVLFISAAVLVAFLPPTYLLLRYDIQRKDFITFNFRHTVTIDSIGTLLAFKGKRIVTKGHSSETIILAILENGLIL